ncbi:MAG: septum formation family protein [Actinomycetota bacterium]|nr:septum formation family protein [Actinomycetota bacterium]
MRSAVVVVSTAVILGGCTDSKSGSKAGSKPSATSTAIPAAQAVPKVGQCLAKEVPDLDDFAPDFNSRVDCTKPHIYEVTAVTDVPARFLKGKTPKERIAQRTQLATVANEDKSPKLSEFIGTGCGAASANATGLSKFKFNGKSAQGVYASPISRGAATWINMIDAGNWAEGRRKFVCTIRYTKKPGGSPDGAPGAVRSKSDAPAFHNFFTKDFPLNRRQCVAYQAGGEGELIACDKQHYGEMFVDFDAYETFGPDFLESIGLNEPTEKQWKKLNSPCVDALPTILGKDYDKDVTAVAERGLGGWIGNGDFFPTSCVIVARDKRKDLPGGSLIGDAKDVELVSAGTGRDI